MAESQEVTRGTADQQTYEFAFEPVPKDKRKSTFSLFMVLAGYPITVSNFVTGTAIGYRMTFFDALVAIVAADAFLILIAIGTGIVSYKTGLSTSFLSRSAFGKKGSAIFSLLLALSAVNWIGINGNTFASMVVENWHWWPIPMAVTSALIILVWSISATHGYKGLEFISWIGVPTTVFMALACFVIVGIQYDGYGAVASYVPDSNNVMSFTEASASIVGSWVFGCLISPDVCRFARSKGSVAIAGIGAFSLGLFCLQVIGIVIGQVAHNGDFTVATAAIGLGPLVLACTLVSLCTTQDNSIYGASLAMQNVLSETRFRGKVKHKYIAFGVALLSAIFAACGALSYLLPIISFLSVLMAPIPALILAEHYFVKRSKSGIGTNPVALVSWLLGGVCGQVCLELNFFVSPVVAFAFTMVVYTVLSRMFDGKVFDWARRQES